MDTVIVISASQAADIPAVSILREAGWRVRPRRLDMGRQGLVSERPDLVVVDVPSGRPVRSTVETFLGAPGMASIPIVALIDPGQAADAAGIGGLADFAMRPVHPEELAARARRLVVTEARDADDCIVVGGLRIDLRAWEVRIEGELVDFTYQEYQLLCFLAGHPGRVFTRDQLLARVWGVD
ncbi:MAG: winged helix-turn-helix domain-containing protein, partial [Myxococcota bacterium]|nr:winged helix-turn-helix domain-containing protein [Myxococcota bacterium]